MKLNRQNTMLIYADIQIIKNRNSNAIPVCVAPPRIELRSKV